MNKLILGNNLEILKEMEDNFVDCTITSPPYNKKENKNTGGIFKAVKYDSISDSLPEKEYQEKQIEIINELYRVTKHGGHLFYNHKIRYEDGLAIFPFEWLSKTKWRIRQEIIWDRQMAVNVRAWRFPVMDERIYWLYKPIDDKDRGKELIQLYAKEGSIWRFRPEVVNYSKGIKEKVKDGNKEKVKDIDKHPAPFPIDLPKKILAALYSNKTNKIILDPYVGSGTTAVAAKEFGHRYIGIDISENYLKIAKERLSNSKENVLDNFIK